MKIKNNGRDSKPVQIKHLADNRRNSPNDTRGKEIAGNEYRNFQES
jgi:hypothetical protein